MKIGRCLLIASQTFLFVACTKNENMPKRKDGYTCNITFEKDNCIKIINNKPVAPIDEEFRFSLEIAYDHDPNAKWEKPPTKEDPNGELDRENKEYIIRPDDIHVYIGDQEYKDSYNFYYVNNTVNEFVIKKEYMVNDVRIVLKASERPTPLTLFALEFSNTLDQRIEYPKEEDPNKDIILDFKSAYQQDGKKPIFIYGGGNLRIPVFEHDAVDLTIKLKNNSINPLPDDIVMRTNARYAKEGVDYTREYLDPIEEDGEIKGYREYHIVIPTYVICDHVAISQNGEK